MKDEHPSFTVKKQNQTEKGLLGKKKKNIWKAIPCLPLEI